VRARGQSVSQSGLPAAPWGRRLDNFVAHTEPSASYEVFAAPVAVRRGRRLISNVNSYLTVMCFVVRASVLDASKEVGLDS
jgi:hypothetical protein